ncbi:MarC family protein [Candidatus Aerophobetes bacterium]|nr:MarC family protein [Candidatus Aerophobetes bacterium]
MNIHSFFLSFISIFVAVDAFGVLPIFISLTEGITDREKLQVLKQSITTALAVAIGFVFIGKAIFNYLGITVDDFLIAGGIILFVLAVVDLLFPTKNRRSSPSLGVVPLGMPLIVGPAVLATSLICIDSYGIIPTFFSILFNVLIAGLVFYSSKWLMRLLGNAGTRAISKLSSLLLAAIGIMMVRKGIIHILKTLT